MTQFYDGMKMRSRYPGEKRYESLTLVAVKFLYGLFYILLQGVAHYCRRATAFAANTLRGCG